MYDEPVKVFRQHRSFTRPQNVLSCSRGRVLRVFEKKVVIGMFRPRKELATREWRELHSDDLHNSYCSPNIVRRIN